MAYIIPVFPPSDYPRALVCGHYLEQLKDELDKREIEYNSDMFYQSCDLDYVLALSDTVDDAELYEWCKLWAQTFVRRYTYIDILVAKKPCYWEFIGIEDRMVQARIRYTGKNGACFDGNESFTRFQIKEWNMKHGYCKLWSANTKTTVEVQDVELFHFLANSGLIVLEKELGYEPSDVFQLEGSHS
ncbi:hypothetical protein H2198_006758 [Neophaeococcomyces mojaviensis]|uniref:Uncharacterized protein n=1 Tax=Neophaeococcomyces mojaviensis TaxID=3383035 RepID=A0ACC3A1U6_9EURO|nr:hypothetical protein H2198_006758 [Knufia sp. JES_112]